MTLPVSSYEELLVQVRGITNETILLRRQLSSELQDNGDDDSTDVNHNIALRRQNYENGKLLVDNATRNRVKGRELEDKQAPLYERRYQCAQLSSQGLAVDDQIQSGKLTARLLSWQNRNHQCNDTSHEEGGGAKVFAGAQPSREKSVGVEGGLPRRSWESRESPTDQGDQADQDIKDIKDVKGDEGRPGCLLLLDRQQPGTSTNGLNNVGKRQLPITRIRHPKDNDEMDADRKDDSERESNTSTPDRLYVRSDRRYEHDESSEEDSPDTSLRNQRSSSLCQGKRSLKKDHWTINRPSGFPQQSTPATLHNEISGAMSGSTQGQRRLGAKMDVVCNLLGMLGSTNSREDMSMTLLSMSNSAETCLVMRESGCLPLLVQLIHAPGQDAETRERAARALHNVVHVRKDDKSCKRREVRVLKLLEQLRDYCQSLRNSVETGQMADELERHPGATITSLMRLSFDEAHRHAMCQLGGLHAIAELIEVDHAAHGSECDDQHCITFRRYAGMALTNLTFGDDNNKALLCSFRDFMKALVSQLQSPSDDLRQVTASVLRNLSWRADSSSKQTLREVGAVVGLMRAAMEGRKESTLKSILSALWNLSAHCTQNKVDICGVEGALAFLVDMLSYKAPSKTLAIVENAGGILRNVSSHIAVREDYRAIVRERGCLQVLLRQLRSPSLTVVSNACGALWNLSARCPRDQQLLWELGAVPMLRSLVHSRHKMISMGSSAALKNLLSARPNGNNLFHLDSTARGLGLPTLPTLEARRQRALEQEIDQSLSETCDNIEPSTSPVNKDDKFSFKIDQTFIDLTTRARNMQQMPGPSNARYNNVVRSESRESMRSVTSTHSDTIFEKVNRHAVNGRLAPDMQIKQQSASLHSAVGFDLGLPIDVTGHAKGDNHAEKKYAMRYKNAADYNLKSTISWSSGPEQDPSCSQILLRSPTDKSQPKNLSYENGGIFGDYAETDLDQPTDYSLRYTEQVLDEEKPNPTYATNSELDLVQMDTVKTYCTEGTPRQTSLTASRAAFASDLQKKVTELNKLGENRERIEKMNLKIHADWQRVSGSQTRAISPDKIREPQSVNQRNTASTSSRATFNANQGVNNFTTSTAFEDESKIRNDVERKEWNVKLDNFVGSIEQNSDGDDDDEDLLACIHIGMQNNRHRQSFRRNSFEQDSQAKTNLTRYQTSNALNQVDGFTTGDESADSELDNEQCCVASRGVCEGNDFNSSQTYSTTPIYLSLEDREANSDVTDVETESLLQSKNPQADSLKTPTSTSDSLDSFVTVDQSVRHVPTRLSPKCETKDSPIDPLFEAVEAAQNRPLKFREEEYRRQRDPDAMIASMDRLTATLVQQTEAMRERDNSIALKQSLTSDTWNEESPNDVSFPSISMSAPLVGSFKSDVQDVSIVPESISENNQMTDSRIIEFEATKLAEAMHAEMNKHSYIDLENIKPPSTMGSLISLSTSAPIENSLDIGKPIKGVPIIARKKSLPVGMVAKRAVAGQNHHTGSLESLLNDCNHSQLENYKPPSMMDELPDAADMENSMISVASITSEVADVKDHEPHSLTSSDPFDLVKPVANVLAITCMRYAEMPCSANNSYSECLENINPPSLFNEVNDLEESSLDLQTTDYTTCNETLCIDGETEFHTDTHVNPMITDAVDEMDDTDEGATPIHTEYCASSSAESTPKKQHNKTQLTPKQKRQLAKERYMTYTIVAPEIDKTMLEVQRKQEQEEARRSKAESPNSKPTPKQRRQEDRARFQTQVLGNEVLEVICPPTNSDKVEIESPVQTAKPTSPPVRSGIPTLKKSGYRTFTKSKPSSEKVNDQTKPESSLQSPTEQSTLNGRIGIAKIQRTSIMQIPPYGKKVESEPEEMDNSDESDNSDGKQAKTGPRIIKPGMTRHLSVESTDKVEAETPKGIRGRRKMLYSSPTPRKLTPQSSPLKQSPKPVSGIPIGRSNTSPIVRSTRATTLRQNNSLQKSNTSPKMSMNPERRPASASFAQKRTPTPVKNTNANYAKYQKRHSIPPGNQNETKVTRRPLERQGTFTKDEPEMDNAPTVPSVSSSPNKSRIGKPMRNTVKIPSSPAKSKSSVKSPKRALPSESKTLPTLSQNQKLVKEAESKIAILFKKAEENRVKQKLEKDTRKWLGPNGGALSVNDSPTKLHRSSTFEGISQNEETFRDIFTAEKLSETTKFRNSCDLSDMSDVSDTPCKIPVRLSRCNGGVRDEEPARRKSGSTEEFEKRMSRLGSFFRVEAEEDNEDGGVARAPASAIVAPFNYHPEGVSYSTKDRREGEGKRSEIVTGSAKVTTV